MKANLLNLSTLSYAQGFTLWLYKDDKIELEAARKVDFFDFESIVSGDCIILSLKDAVVQMVFRRQDKHLWLEPLGPLRPTSSFLPKLCAEIASNIDMDGLHGKSAFHAACDALNGAIAAVSLIMEDRPELAPYLQQLLDFLPITIPKIREMAKEAPEPPDGHPKALREE